ncbi:MAG TPA: hypothetical protein PLU30_23935 [Verrucomicrobiae bacterium]|nr:hypothetical protein [Verrucomicrobiae bacterium]
MKKLFVLAAVLGQLLPIGAFGADRNSFVPTGEIIWAGIDYSQVRLIGPAQFNDADAIFPGYFEKWNDLFLRERIDIVQRDTQKTVIPDIGGVTAANRTASARQIIESPDANSRIDQTHITPAQIAAMVKGYDMKHQSGLGIVFIVDRLIKIGKKGEGAVYVVGFDVATRQVRFAGRQICPAQGYGFRNYWFRVVKEAEKALKEVLSQPPRMNERAGRRR